MNLSKRETLKNEWAPLIRKWRESLNLTRKEACVVLGVSAKTIEAWEYGKKSPTSLTSRLMKEILNQE
jgi:DNA-binding transcriptional regulator YiaG